MPVLTDYPYGPDTWQPGAILNVRFPGTVPPDTSTVGAIPYPLLEGTLALPPDILDLHVNDEPVRAPEHTDEIEDDVRFAGPWYGPMRITWTPASEPSPLTIAIRTVGVGAEGTCDCSTDCGPGFECDAGVCVGVDGASWVQVGEMVCTVADDGEFVLGGNDTQELWDWAGPDQAAGTILVVARTTSGEVSPADVLTFNGKRVENGPVRTRGIDAIYTRLRAPE